jgi:hypothetical protein
MMERKQLDLRSLPSAREVISHPQGGLFPVQVTLPNGDIAAIARGGAGHLGQAGRLDLCRSKDGGLTWTPPAVIVDSDEDDRNPAFGVTADGTLVLSYMRQASYTNERRYEPSLENSDVCVMTSRDDGLSWSAPVRLDRSTYPRMSPYGRIITLKDGTALMPIYTASGTPAVPGGSYYLRSTDNGATWSPPQLIAKDMNETTLIQLPSGDILAAMRETAREHQRLWTSRSSDGGFTWSPPELVTDDRQHPADLLLLPNGTLLLLYGNRSGPYRIEGRYSHDEGRTWKPTLLALSGHLYGYDVPSPRPTDFGYPSGALTADGNRLVVTYYVAPFPRIQERDWTGPWTTPFYQSAGYMGISLSVDVAELLEALDG